MCTATPGEVVELRENHLALVSFGGVRKEVSIFLLDGVALGDYVLVHVGFAIEKIDPDEATRTLTLMAEISPSVTPDQATFPSHH